MGGVAGFEGFAVVTDVFAAVEALPDFEAIGFVVGQVGTEAANDGFYPLPLFAPLGDGDGPDAAYASYEGVEEAVVGDAPLFDNGEVDAVKVAFPAGGFGYGTFADGVGGEFAPEITCGGGGIGHEVAGAKFVLEEVFIEVFQGGTGVGSHLPFDSFAHGLLERDGSTGHEGMKGKKGKEEGGEKWLHKKGDKRVDK